MTIHKNDNVALEVGRVYRLGNSSQGCDFVEIVAMDFTNVYAKGVGNNIADLVIPRWKFDDLVPEEESVDADSN